MRLFLNIFFLITIIICSSNIHAQRGLVLSNNANIIIKNNGFLVLSNNGGIANIDTISGGGQIISEGENNIIRWHLADTTGSFILPFGTQTIAQGGNGISIPLHYTINTAGSISGSIDFSTYETVTDMNTPWPTSVTNMDNASGSDNTLYVVDRFWKIDTNNYLVTPEINFEFTYDNSSNELGGTNTISELNLNAQNWNSNSQEWLPGVGILNLSSHSVESVSTTTSFWPIWTLVDNTSPLPIELIEFNAELVDNRQVQLSWVTYSELNNDFFSVERSKDAINWEVIIPFVDGAGNSVQKLNYQAIDSYPLNGKSYYRLKQTDFNGAHTHSLIRAISKDQNSSDLIKLYPNPNGIGEFTIEGVIQSIKVFDMMGREIDLPVSIEQGRVDCSSLNKGSYVVHITADDNVFSEILVVH